MTTRFQPGGTVVRREIMRGEPWIAIPQICVHDDGDLLVTYTPGGSPFGYPGSGAFPVGRHPWMLAGSTHWRGHGRLELHWTGVEHSVFLFWAGDGREFQGWYFNLEDAPRRTPIGFDTLDHELDVWWAADAETYVFKDVEEFEETGPARYPGRMAEIRAEADRIAARLDAGDHWWDKSWADWAPDPAWSPRTLPEGWTTLPFEAR
ncbi:DUF402 domain-containing protein [Myceligenerans xiligouense]|uniref:Uncharacterized protein DUF402 n=1 Tax=Myceligenerans xiligouense TaxID=253184 RepID=A0A3N4YL72_9MICO|nr:DUF402 domain-containing protein [Myceligenerans xiligouense]RPF20176.1 uncharacterized protein DUF402 [Myceligenerans xiligouense]